MRKIAFLAIAALLLVGASAAPLNAHDVNALRKIGSFVAYPNSKSPNSLVDLVYSVTYWNETDNVKTTNLQKISYTPGSPSGTPPTHLTYEYGKSDSTPIVSPSGDIIGFMSSRSGSSQFWVVSASIPSSIQQVTSYPLDIDNVKWRRDTVSDFITFTARIYPDCTGQDPLGCTVAKDAALKARGPNTGFVYDSLYVRHWDKWVDGKVSHIFAQRLKVVNTGNLLAVAPVGPAVDIMKGMNANSPVPPFGGAEQYDVCAAGILVAFTAETVDRTMAWSTGWKMYTVKLNAQQWDQPNAPRLISGFTNARTQNPAFSPTGTWLSFLAMDRPGDESDRLHLVLYNVNTRQIVVPDTAFFDRSIAGYAWAQDGKSILIDSDSNGYHALFSASVNVQTGAVTNISLVVGTGTNSGQQHVLGQGWFYLRHTLTEVTGIYWNSDFAEQTSLPVSVTSQYENPNLENKFNLSAPQWISYRSENRTIQAWFLRPYGWEVTMSRKWPLAVLIHGGPEGAWNDGFSFRWNPQLWAARGYAVIAINPTGSTGFGQAFTDAVRGDWGGAPYRDIMNGVEYILAQNPWIDSNRACACGGSYGGYMVNWINSQSNFFKCFVNHDGTFSVSGKYYSTDEIFFQEWEFYGPPFDPAVQNIWNKWNPANYAGSMNSPMLVIHGGLDFRVPITEGISTFTNLQRRGIPSKLLYFPLENHWVLNPNNAIMWNDEVLGWLDRWTTNTPPQ